MLKPKKLLLLSHLFLLSLCPFLFAADETLTITTYYPSPYGSYSQLTADQIAIGSAYRNPTYADGTLYVQDKVGIGTASPQTKLDVSGGAIRALSTISPPGIASGTGIEMVYAGNAVYGQGIGGYIFSYDRGAAVYKPLTFDASNLNFDVFGGTNMAIATSGNVGIGTSAPAERLELSGSSTTDHNIRFTDTRTDAGSDPIGQIQFATNTQGLGVGGIIAGINESVYGHKRVALAFYTIDTMFGGLGERMRIDGFGNIGIGTTLPGVKLDVGNTSGYNAVRINGGTSADNGAVLLFRSGTTTYGAVGAVSATYGGAYDDTLVIFGYGSSSGAIRFDTNLVERMRITSGGNVGIGVTSPSYQLQLSTDSAAKPGTNTWTIASDIRIKKDIRPYTNGLSIIKRINPVWFKYNGKAGLPLDNQNHIGVIGQEIVKVAPYTVNTFKAKLNPEDKKETELLNFNSHALTFDLINAVKELDANITKFAQELTRFKERLSRLEARVK